MSKKRNRRRKRRGRKRKPNVRNHIAVAAFQHGGSGRHTDQKKEADKKACRGKVEDQ